MRVPYFAKVRGADFLSCLAEAETRARSYYGNDDFWLDEMSFGQAALDETPMRKPDGQLPSTLHEAGFRFAATVVI